MKDYLSESSTVLDVGCNCGFLDLQIASFVKRIVGVDIDPHMIQMGKYVSDYLGIENTSLLCQNIFLCELKEQFDAVCLFAVHTPILRYGDISKEEFSSKIIRLIKQHGYLFFESHAYFSDSSDEDYVALDEIFRKNGLRLISYRYHYGSQAGNMNRDISIHQNEVLE